MTFHGEKLKIVGNKIHEINRASKSSFERVLPGKHGLSINRIIGKFRQGVRMVSLK